MKKVGILGGLGPEATVAYYRGIIAGVQERRGTKTFLPEMTINSINMYHMFQLMEQPDSRPVVDYLAQGVEGLTHAGADFAVMCGNTPHRFFQQVQQQVSIPMLSMVTTSVEQAKKQGFHRLGLLGTKFTMQGDFFKAPFQQAGIEIVVPSAEQQTFVHQKIVSELENGIVKETTRQALVQIVTEMATAQHIEGIVLGCTELPLILNEASVSMPALDIAQIHIDAIVDQICNPDKADHN